MRFALMSLTYYRPRNSIIAGCLSYRVENAFENGESNCVVFSQLPSPRTTTSLETSILRLLGSSPFVHPPANIMPKDIFRFHGRRVPACWFNRLSSHLSSQCNPLSSSIFFKPGAIDGDKTSHCAISSVISYEGYSHSVFISTCPYAGC